MPELLTKPVRASESDAAIEAWVTKYALTSGIKKIRARLCQRNMVEDIDEKFSAYYHGEGVQWHRSEEAARAQAEKMRTAKIAALKKQILKLEALKF